MAASTDRRAFLKRTTIAAAALLGAPLLTSRARAQSDRLVVAVGQVSQFVGYQNITSKKYLETVGEEKAALHPIGTGPYRHVEGRQGD